MEKLCEGTKISMNLRTDWMIFRYKTETGEVGEIGYKSFNDEIFEDKVIEELVAVIKHPSFEATMLYDVPILEDYKNTNYRLVYKEGRATYISDRVIGYRKFHKMKPNSKINMAEFIKLSEEEQYALIDLLAEDGESYIVKTEDGIKYCFDIL